VESIKHQCQENIQICSGPRYHAHGLCSLSLGSVSAVIVSLTHPCFSGCVGRAGHVKRRDQGVAYEATTCCSL
jgi:hypothetical protein